MLRMMEVVLLLECTVCESASRREGALTDCDGRVCRVTESRHSFAYNTNLLGLCCRFDCDTCRHFSPLKV